MSSACGCTGSNRSELHRHVSPDVQVTVYGADRPGIVAQVTAALAAADLTYSICNTTSAVLTTDLHHDYRRPCDQGIEVVETAFRHARGGIEVESPIDTLIG